jgi:chromate reductase, NAD(P)H dehydrogenase (quinone)
MNQILVFAGSTRAESFNRKLAQVAAASGSAQGAQVTLIDLADYDIPLYNADVEAKGTPHDVLKLKALMHAHAGWVICSPEYNGSMTSLLKNTIDWCSSPAKSGQLHGPEVEAEWGDGFKPFKGKVVGLMAASPGGMGGIRSLTDASKLFLNLHCWVSPEQFALGRAGSAFAADGSLVDPANAKRVDAVVAKVLWAAGRLVA